MAPPLVIDRWPMVCWVDLEGRVNNLVPHRHDTRGPSEASSRIDDSLESLGVLLGLASGFPAPFI